MRSVVLAYSEMGCTGLELLLELGADVAGVFTHEDDPDEQRWFRSVAELAERAGIPVWKPARINSTASVERIRALAPEMLFSFYYRRIVSDRILGIPPRGCFNLHGSLLPRYRGRSPTNWAVLNGERATGVTLHEMVAEADAGAIVAQRSVPIAEDASAHDVMLLQIEAFRELMRDVYPALGAGTAPRVRQDESRATVFPGRRPEDGAIDWSVSARAIHDLVRAVTHPYPGAFAWLSGRKCFIWRTRLAASQGGPVSGPPGTIIAPTPNGALVQCGDGVLEVLEAELESPSNRKLYRRPLTDWIPGSNFDKGAT